RWPGLAAIGKVVRVRETATKTTTETAYYLLSTALSGERFNDVVRSHWGIENCLHWRLDVVMNEDQDRSRLGNGPNNLAVLRHMALNVMQKDPFAANSNAPDGTTHISPSSWPCFEMRLPWHCFQGWKAAIVDLRKVWWCWRRPSFTAIPRSRFSPKPLDPFLHR